MARNRQQPAPCPAPVPAHRVGDREPGRAQLDRPQHGGDRRGGRCPHPQQPGRNARRHHMRVPERRESAYHQQRDRHGPGTGRTARRAARRVHDGRRGPAPGPGPQEERLQHAQAPSGGGRRRLRGERHQEQHRAGRQGPHPACRRGVPLDVEGQGRGEQRQADPGGQAQRERLAQRRQPRQPQQRGPDGGAEHTGGEREGGGEPEGRTQHPGPVDGLAQQPGHVGARHDHGSAPQRVARGGQREGEGEQHEGRGQCAAEGLRGVALRCGVFELPREAVSECAAVSEDEQEHRVVGEAQFAVAPAAVAAAQLAQPHGASPGSGRTRGPGRVVLGLALACLGVVQRPLRYLPGRLGGRFRGPLGHARPPWGSRIAAGSPAAMTLPSSRTTT